MKRSKGLILLLLIYSTVFIILDLINDSDFNIVREFYFLFIIFWVFFSFFFAVRNSSIASVLSIAKSVGLFSISIAVTFLLNYFRVLLASHYNVKLYENKTQSVIDIISIYIQFSFYSIGYYFFIRMLDRQKKVRFVEKSKMETENLKLEAENRVLQLQEEKVMLQTQLLESEINFLRAQINPHFLFNCLNFFYSEMLDTQPKVADGIITLSEIMRYSLQDFSKTGGLANLQQELEHIQNVIKIHKMRFANNLFINLGVDGNPENIQVAPMVLITLVENIFKHGDLHDAKKSASIICSIDQKKNMIHFSTSNKRKLGSTSIAAASGMGLDNIRKRMFQLYRDKFSLKAVIEADQFMVVLEIPYHPKGQLGIQYSTLLNYTI